jgi:hypothetical protein
LEFPHLRATLENVTHARFQALFPPALVTALLLPSVLVTAVYLGTGTLWPNDPPPAPRGSVVVWADRAFTTSRGFEMWLEANGGDYQRWARNHPHAAARLSRSPRARRAVLRSAAARRPNVAAGPSQRQAHFILFGIAAGAVALFLIAVVRRLPRPSIPALALGGSGGDGGRLVPLSFPSLPRVRAPDLRRFVPRAPVRPPAENRRSLHVPVRELFATGVPAARRVVSPEGRSEHFDLAFGIFSIVLGLIVGILVPVFLAS